jgi:pyruvate dehydrogenase E2 component (dihydrolipoamide acetyltransferase)
VGQEAKVGAVLAILLGEGEVAPAPAMAAQPAAAAVGVAAPVAEPVVMAAPASSPAGNGHRVRVSPLARRLAEELHVDLGKVIGTGPGGAIERHDVEKAAASKVQGSTFKVQGSVLPAEDVTQVAPPPAVAPSPVPGPVAEAPAPVKEKGSEEFQAGMRRAIALAMARSNREIPHYYLEQRIDMSTALRWLEGENQKRPIQSRVLPAVLLIKAVAKALTKVPELNAFWIDDRLQVQEGIHIGFAIALRQGGLVTPAIHHADLKSMDELMEALRDLIMRTRAGRLRSSELTDATIVLTSLGDMGVEKTFGVIYPPQVALVGFGKVIDEVWVENGMIGVRPVVHATLAGDHRASDGRTGAGFLDFLNKYLQEPESLWS